MKNKRFTISEDGKSGVCNTYTILVDKKTGVNYLFVKSGYGAGLTPLLDEKGNVVVTK